MTPDSTEIHRKDAVLQAALLHAPFDGWTREVLDRALADAGHPGEGPLLFPRGSIDLVAHFFDHATRLTLDKAPDLAALKVREKIALLVKTRLSVLEPWREAVRLGLSVLVRPDHMATGVRLLADTASAFWYLVGDKSTDYNWYTKRMLLAGVIGSSTLYWLNDRSPGHVETEAFIDRQISRVMTVGAWPGKLADLWKRDKAHA
ncbi:MAG: COQ9 family protein [Pseudomonadota bacterium]|nr:COQ9 family protein [Pseudomonadota bacterium]